MTDQEVIADFMESKPEVPRLDSWWWLDSALLGGKVFPRELDLDRLRLVEERLTDEQWANYLDYCWGFVGADQANADTYRCFIHASAEQKIKALASVIRGEKK